MGIPIPVEAKLDERTATAAANRAQRVFADAGRDAGRQFSEGITGGAKGAEESLRKFGDRASDAYDKARDAAGKLRSEEEKLSDLRDRGARNSQVVSQAERVERARRAEARAIRDASDAWRQYIDAADDADNAGGRAGSSFVQGLQSGISDASGGLPSGIMTALSAARMAGVGLTAGAALGAGIVTAVVAGVAALGPAVRDGMQINQMTDVFQASMGLDAASMGRVGNAAGDAYAQGFGASMADNLATAQVAMQGGLIDSQSSDAEMQSIIEKVQSVSQVTGATAQEITRSVTMLMRTGLADNVTAAMDIVVAGFQKGLDQSQDWLDTINQYSTQFRKLGLDARDFTGLLKQGLEGGARDTDNVADSLKEFSIRAVDGSKLTREGFQALGLDADDMGRRFAEGGESARTAFGVVLEQLRTTGDAQQQALVWQSLFGTQWEDMGQAIQNLDLSTARSKFQDLEGTSTDATKTATDNFKSQWNTAMNAVEQRMNEFKSGLADWLTSLPIIRDIPQIITDLMNPATHGPTSYSNPAYTPQPINPLDVVTGSGPAPATTPGQVIMPGAGQLVPATGPDLASAPQPGGAPAVGDRTPMLTDTQAQAQKDADAAAKAAAKNIDPSLFSLDSVPIGGFQGLGAGAALPAVTPGGAYGLPAGTDTGGYGSSGPMFPAWVHAIENAFGVKASTYGGHQETDRNEAGYAPNPGHENRGIDWSGTTQNMQRFADYLKTIPGALEQVIWNGAGIGSGDTVEIAGGRPQPGYFADDLAGHGNHVHTRQSGPIPLPGSTPAVSYGTGGQAYAQPGYGYYDVDQQKIFDADTAVLSARNSVEQARARVLELEADNNSTAAELNSAKNAVVLAERGYQSAEAKAAEARQGTWKKLENSANSMASGMDQIGASLDKDFGISKGLPGIAENLTKFIANLAFAPMLGALSGISAASGGAQATGSGLIGIGAAQGAFGPQFMPGGGGFGGIGIPGAGPFGITPAGQSAITPTGFLPPMSPAAAASPGPGNFGNYGGIQPSPGPGGGFAGIGGMPMAAISTAASGLDALAPGAGAAAQVGIQEINRAIAFGGQAAGIGVGWLLDTFLPSGGSELAANNWITRIAGGFAGAAPALPNMAGKSAQQPQPGQADPNAAAAGGAPITVNYTNQQATEDRAGADLTRHLSAMNSAPGPR